MQCKMTTLFAIQLMCCKALHITGQRTNVVQAAEDQKTGVGVQIDCDTASFLNLKRR